jgi:UDP-N-acetylmuramoyl-tripeptide--D-alanyl-D-alanine ligase
MMRTVLAASGPVHASAASFNNHWGVPLTLARMPLKTRFGVFEIGMNHPDEIRPLVKMVRPHIAIITNVAAAHLGAFDSIDGIARAKAEIFEGLVSGGYGLINKDDKRAKLLGELASAAGVEHLLTFGTKRGSDFRLVSVEHEAEHSRFKVSLRGNTHDVVLNVQGDHFIMNSLAVLGVADLAGADLEKSVAAIAEITPEKGRGRRHILLNDRVKFTLIDESYNANPASMRAALASLGTSKTGSKGRRIAVLGEMLELGKTSEKLHRELAEPIGEFGIDKVYTVGEGMSVLGEELEKKTFVGHFKDWKAVEADLAKSLRHGDVIMVKASNGLRFADLVEALCTRYSVTKKATEKPKRLGSR